MNTDNINQTTEQQNIASTEKFEEIQIPVNYPVSSITDCQPVTGECKTFENLMKSKTEEDIYAQLEQPQFADVIKPRSQIQTDANINTNISVQEIETKIQNQQLYNTIFEQYVDTITKDIVSMLNVQLPTLIQKYIAESTQKEVSPKIKQVKKICKKKTVKMNNNVEDSNDITFSQMSKNPTYQNVVAYYQEQYGVHPHDSNFYDVVFAVTRPRDLIFLLKYYITGKHKVSFTSKNRLLNHKLLIAYDEAYRRFLKNPRYHVKTIRNCLERFRTIIRSRRITKNDLKLIAYFNRRVNTLFSYYRTDYPAFQEKDFDNSAQEARYNYLKKLNIRLDLIL